MNLKVLFLIIIYWSFWIVILASGGAEVLLEGGYSTTADFNASALSLNETDRGGLFNTGVSFTRFFGLALFGVGLPDSLPAFFKLLINVWQVGFTVFTVGFILSSIWNG